MIEFDHGVLARKLEVLSVQIRPLFAAVVAERLFPHAREFFEQIDLDLVADLRFALDDVWRFGIEGVLSPDRLEAGLAVGMRAMDSADDVAAANGMYPLTGVQRKAAEESGIKPLRLRDVEFDNWRAINAAFYAENAAAAIAYGLRAIATSDPIDSAWAGQRAYDTVDRFVMVQELELGVEWTEAEICNHPVVQRELQRQADDIEALRHMDAQSSRPGVAQLQERARDQAASLLQCNIDKA